MKHVISMATIAGMALAVGACAAETGGGASKDAATLGKTDVGAKSDASSDTGGGFGPSETVSLSETAGSDTATSPEAGPSADTQPTPDPGPPVDAPGPTDVVATDAAPDTPAPNDTAADTFDPNAPTCGGYCKAVMEACPGELAQYGSAKDCADFCGQIAQWSPGKVGDLAGNTTGCRLHRATLAKAGQAKAHCPPAGPTGGGACGTWCDNYCALAAIGCSGAKALYADEAACQLACKAFPTAGAPGDTTGDSVQCRTNHALAAAADPTGGQSTVQCPIAAPDGGKVCVKPAGGSKGDVCDGAFVVDALPYTNASSTADAADDYHTATGCNVEGGPFGQGFPDHAYVFKPTESGTYVAGLADNDSGGATILYVTTGCADLAASCTAYSDDLFGGGSFTVTLEAGKTYYFIADGLQDGDAGSYTFTLAKEGGGTCVPKCDGKLCGPDGCGKDCGSCPADKICGADGQCQGAPVGQSIDLSGWILFQDDGTGTTHTLTLPAGTAIASGGTLVVGRNATQAKFEAFWGKTLPSNAKYVSGGNKYPIINAKVKLTLKKPDGVAVDGPTVAAATGKGFQRTGSSQPAGVPASWTTIDTKLAPEKATPGVGLDDTPGFTGVAISEFCDASGTGLYIYEFIELYYDP